MKFNRYDYMQSKGKAKFPQSLNNNVLDYFFSNSQNTGGNEILVLFEDCLSSSLVKTKKYLLLNKIKKRCINNEDETESKKQHLIAYVFICLENYKVKLKEIAEAIWEYQPTDYKDEAIKEILVYLYAARNKIKKVLKKELPSFKGEEYDDFKTVGAIKKYVQKENLLYSLTKKDIENYRTAYMYWKEPKVNGESWQDIYNIYIRKEPKIKNKKNEHCFAASLCKEHRNIKRSWVQTYLHDFVEPIYFTKYDLKNITDDCCSKDEFFSFLKKQKLLSTKDFKSLL